MSVTRFSVVFVLCAVLTTVLQHAWYWPQLPQRVATHFGVDGQPNAWMSRTAATFLLAGVQIGVPLFLVAVNCALASLPDSMLKIPNRDYWLSSDNTRREATLAYMRRMNLLAAVLTFFFLFVVVHLAFLANRNNSGLNLAALLTALGLFILLIVFGVALPTIRRFHRPAQSPAYDMILETKSE